MGKKHAILSPSAAHRWMECESAPYAEQGIVLPPSPAAAEGTRAHTWAEKILNDIKNREHYLELCEVEENKISGQGQEMRMFVNNYIDYIGKTHYEERLKSNGGKYLMYIEKRVYLTPEVYGTADFAMLNKTENGTYRVITRDLKYGRGIPVPAKNNWQQIIYGLGMYLELPQKLRDSIKKANVHFEIGIYQPRTKGESADEWGFSGEEAVAFHKKITDKARTALQIIDGTLDHKKYYKPGAWCQFCKAKLTCKAYRADYKHNLQKMITVIESRPSVKEHNIDELAYLLTRKKDMSQFMTEAEQYLYQCTMNFIKVPHFKLVETKSKRAIIDDAKSVIKICEDAGIKTPYKKVPLNIGEIKAALGNKKAEKILPLVTTTPTKGYAMVPESDKRPEVSRADDLKALLDTK